MSVVRALVITGFGINCQEELAAAWRLAGAEAEIVHFNELLGGLKTLDGYDVLNFPGGFSFGDDLGAGKALANKLRFCRLPGGGTLLDGIAAHVDAGGYVLGICNGFQILVKSGLLPNIGGLLEQEVSLIVNDSGKFEDRWVRCGVNPKTSSPFLAGMDQLELPIRHKEGKLVICDDEIRTQILEQGLCSLRYINADGTRATQYPALPNGSEFSCAALTDPTGRVLGMMPHPEAFLSQLNHPDWGRRSGEEDPGAAGDGLRLFTQFVEHIRRNRS